MEEMKTLTVDGTTYEVVDDLARSQLQSLSELSTETDAEGNKILKVVDAAPFGYDPSVDAIKTATVASRKVKYINLGPSTAMTFEANEKYSVVLRPPVGKIWRISFMVLNTSPGTAAEGTTGNHQFVVRYAANDSTYNILQGQTAYTKTLDYVCGNWSDDVATQKPSDKTTQYLIIRDLNITYDFPLHIIYQNRTNNSLAARPVIRFIVTEEDLLV